MHGLDIFELMELGARCGLPMPRLPAIYGIEIGNEVAFDARLSHELNERLPVIAEEIVADITVVLPSLSVSAASN